MKTERRKQILDALHKCLLIKPFDRTTIKDIAEKAGMNHGMLHYYYKSKDDILLAYIDYCLELYTGIFQDWLNLNRSRFLSPEDSVHAMMDFMGEKITLNKDLSRIFIEIWEIGNYNGAVRKKLRETYREWISVTTGFLNDQFGESEKVNAMGVTIVALSEGLSLLSVILEPSDVTIKGLMPFFKEIISIALKQEPVKG